MKESTSSHRYLIFCVWETTRGCRIVHAFNKECKNISKVNEEKVLTQTSIPREDVIMDRMYKTSIVSSMHSMKDSIICGMSYIIYRNEYYMWYARWMDGNARGLNKAPVKFKIRALHLLRQVQRIRTGYIGDVSDYRRNIDEKSYAEARKTAFTCYCYAKA